MTSGLKWPEHAFPYGNVAQINRRMWEASDPYRFLLAQPLAATPGTTWNYNSGGWIRLALSCQKVSLGPLGPFARKALFGPLGITPWQWGNPSWARRASYLLHQLARHRVGEALVILGDDAGWRP